MMANDVAGAIARLRAALEYADDSYALFAGSVLRKDDLRTILTALQDGPQPLGASVPDQALAVPAEPVSRLGPSGFDPSRSEAMLLSLLDGPFTSLSISFNDSHAPNYQTARQWADDDAPFGGYNDPEEWVSPEERERALAENSVWECHWYPNTPVRFCRLYASSFTALLAGLSAQAIEARQGRNRETGSDPKDESAVVSDDAPKDGRVSNQGVGDAG